MKHTNQKSRGFVRLVRGSTFGSAMALALLGGTLSASVHAPALAVQADAPLRAPAFRARADAALPVQYQSRQHRRDVFDQDQARHRHGSGENRSFEELFRRASAIGKGEYLGVEPDITRNVYRFKFMRPSGNVVWVDMDGRTGRVIAERQ